MTKTLKQISEADCGSGEIPQDGFLFSYVVNDYVFVQKFGDANCKDVIDKFVLFLQGCGYAPASIAVCMSDAAEELSQCWSSPLAEALSLGNRPS